MQIVNAALRMAQAEQTGKAASPQLRQAANQFEASFLQELLKPMTEDSLFGSSSGAASGSMGTVRSLAAQALADGIAKNGGLGIAKRVLAELTPMETAKSGGKHLAGGSRCGGCAPDLRAISNGPRAAEPSAELLGKGNDIQPVVPGIPVDRAPAQNHPPEEFGKPAIVRIY